MDELKVFSFGVGVVLIGAEVFSSLAYGKVEPIPLLVGAALIAFSISNVF